MNGSENADIWKFERDQYRKQLTEAEAKVKYLDYLTDEQVLLLNSQERQIEELKAEVLRLEADVKAEWKKGYTLGMNDGFSQ